MKLLVFDGIRPNRHTWFETRRSPDLDERGEPRVDPDNGLPMEIGGDIVVAHPGDRFPLDYVDPFHVESHVSRGHAHIIEGELVAPDPAPEVAPPVVAPEPQPTPSRLRARPKPDPTPADPEE